MLEVLEAARWQDWAGTAACALLALSYLSVNLFWLRVLAIVSLVFEALYFYAGPIEPLRAGMAWNAVFIGTNLVMLALLLRERRHLRMVHDEAVLKRGLFADLDGYNFGRLLRLGEWVELPPATVLTREGEPVEYFYVIADGLAEVDVRGHVVALLQNGSFVGEMSLLTNAAAAATVTTLAACQAFRIEQQRLIGLLSRHPEIRAGLDRTIGRDLVRKLKSTRGRPLAVS